MTKAPREDDTDEPERRPRTRRRVAAAAPAAEEDTEPPAAPRGAAAGAHETPSFARDFPRDPALDALVAAFEAGDYARVRRQAPELAKATDRDEVRAAARELARRLDPDPVAAYLLGIAALLLAFLAGWYWLHGHAHQVP